MLNFMPNLKLEADPNNQGGSGGTTPPVKPEAPAASAAPNAPPTQAPGDNLDELGYEKVPPIDEGKPAGDKSKEPSGDNKPDEKVDDIKIEKLATGYGDEPPKVDEEVVTPPNTDVKPEDIKAELGYDLKLDSLPKDEATPVKEFIKQNKVPKEIAEAYIAMRAKEIADFNTALAQAQKNEKLAQQKQRADWHRELKDDPTFGGEKFGFHVKRAEKVLEEFMPMTKKTLTERGSVLPPYVMRDLATLADHLYNNDKLVQGSAVVPKDDEKAKDDGTSFYE